MIIQASGGIVWKKISGEYYIAIIKRERHGKNWSLPKGKLEDNESWTEGAQREIEEEVGVTTQILKYADTITFLANEIPKVVVFYHMLVTGISNTEPDPEVVKINWVTPSEAVSILDYDEQKKLVKGIQYPGKKHWGFKSFIITQLQRLKISVFGKSLLKERIENELKILEYELEFFNTKGGTSQKNNKELKHLINLAKKEIDNNQLETAWKIYHLIKRLNYFNYKLPLLIEEANILKIEAEKLNDWRKRAIIDTIGKINLPDKNLEASSLIRATKIRDEHNDNTYYKNALSQRAIKDLLKILSVCLICLLVWITIYFENTGRFSNLIPMEEASHRALLLMPISIGVFLFGVLGACISSLFHIRDSSKSTRIPELISDNSFTFTRVILGGASALVIFIYLESEISQLLFKEISLRPNSIYTYLAIAFIAGFTERLLLKAVTSVIGKDS